jgi:hypothetical protein
MRAVGRLATSVISEITGSPLYLVFVDFSPLSFQTKVLIWNDGELSATFQVEEPAVALFAACVATSRAGGTSKLVYLLSHLVNVINTLKTYFSF